MSFRLLLDEDTATALAAELNATGHDVERVAATYPDGTTMQPVVFLTDDWL